MADTTRGTTDRAGGSQHSAGQHQGRGAGSDHHTGGADGHLAGHGNSVAAWTGVGIILIGVLASCLSLIFGTWFGFFAGAGVVVLGVVAGNVLSRMGYGSSVPEDSPSSPRQGVR